MKYHCSGWVKRPAAVLCAALLAAPGCGYAQEALTFVTTLDARNIGVSPAAPTDTGIFVPAGAAVTIEFGATGALAANMPRDDGAVPFTLYAYLEGQEAGAYPVTSDAPIHFDGEGQLRLALGNVACGEAGGWGGVAAGVKVRSDRIVTAQDGDRAGAWGLPIVRLAAEDRMMITAGGAVAYWEGGEPFGLDGQGKLLSDALVPGIAANALIGVIGENAPFLVGTSAGDREDAGWLWITVNDQIDKPGAYRNNSGTVNLGIAVIRAGSETGTLAEVCAGGSSAAMPEQGGSVGKGAALELPIAPGQVLVTGAQYRTADGTHSLVFREDGQLVVQSSDGRTIWSSVDVGAPAVPGGSAMVSFSGELALFDAQRMLVWAPVGDMAVPGSILYIADDRVLKMLSPSWTVTWPRDLARVQVQATSPAETAVPQVVPVAPQVVPVVPQVVPVAPQVVPVAPQVVPVAPQVVPVAPQEVPVVPVPAQEPIEQPVEHMPIEDMPVEDWAEAPAPLPEADQPQEVEAGQPMPSILTTMWRQGEGECLTIGQGRYGLGSGVPAGMAPCERTAGQNWLIVPVGDSYAYIANAESELVLCLTSGDGNVAEPRSVPVTAQPCVEAAEQIWQILPQENGYYLLTSLAFGNSMCLEGAAPDYAIFEGAAFMDSCQDVSGQYWTDGSAPQ